MNAVNRIICRTITVSMCVGMLPPSVSPAFASKIGSSQSAPYVTAAAVQAAKKDHPTASTKTTYAVYRFLEHIRDFPDLKRAITYAKQFDHAVVRDTADGVVAWTNYHNRYVVVYVDGKSSYYNSLTQAQAVGAKTPSTYVIDACLWKKVWRNNQVYAFQVTDSKAAVLQRFVLLDDAKRMAQSIPGSRVVNIGSHKTVYSGPPAYAFAVLDAKGKVLKLFTRENAALNYAKNVVQSQVQSLSDQSIVWVAPKYEVFSHASHNLLASYATLDEAVSYAITVNESYVVLVTTKQVVWSNPYSSTSTGADSTNSTGVDSGTTAQNSTAGGVTDAGNSTNNASGSTTNTGLPSVYYSVSNGVLYKHLWSGYAYVIGPAASFMKNGQNYASEGTKFYLVEGNGVWAYAGNYENPYRKVDLRIGSNITAAQVKAFIQSNNSTSPLASLSDAYVEAQQAYGVSAQYLVAHSIIESAYGTSQIAHDKNNLFGYSAFDLDPYNSATTFPSKAYAIFYEAWFVRKNYVEPNALFYNGSNLDGMNVKYATDPNWAESIASIMWKMTPYNPSDYANTPILPSNDQEPFFPYVAGASGTITAHQVDAWSNPTVVAEVYTQLNTGSTVSLTGWAPGWYQISLQDNRTAYVGSEYVKPSNLGKIVDDDVNIQATATLSGSVVEQANYGDQLVILSKSTDGQWLKVQLMDGKNGYVSAKYVAALN